MNPETPLEFVAGLEVGSVHTTIIVAQPPSEPDDGTRHIMGVARVVNNGLKKGSIVNFDAVVSSIQDAVDEVERQTGLDIENVRLSVAGTAAVCDNYTETLTLKNNEVRQSDLDKLLATARAQKPPQGFDFVHVLPTQYIVDGKPGIVNPVGMCGSDFSAICHRVAYPLSDLKNLIKACNAAGLHVESLIFEPLAAAEGVLDNDEKDLGVLCMSIGTSLTHVAVYSAGVPVFCKDYPIGSLHITKDLSIGLRTTQSEAERVKRDFGQALYTPAGASETVTIAGMDTRTTRLVTRGELWNIIEPRVREILDTVHNDLKKLKLKNHLTKGMVLTGGGALLHGICLVAEDVFQCPARIGSPYAVSGVIEGLRTPTAATSVGLLSPLFGKHKTEPSFMSRAASLSTKDGLKSLARNVWSRVTEPFGM